MKKVNLMYVILINKTLGKRYGEPRDMAVPAVVDG
jgi:hypothetical protein